MLTYKRKRNREFPHVQVRQHRETQSMGFRLMDLPYSIILEIMKKMTTEEVLQCRCTCKTLCRLISDPSFVNHFLVRSHFFSLVYRSSLRKIQFARIKEHRIRAYHTLEHVSMRQIPQKDDLELVGSSMGFLCLWNNSSKSNNLYVTNPLFGESVILPKPLGDKYAAIDETYWFGYVPSMGIFKVVRVKVRRVLFQSNPRNYYNKSEVHALVIGSDTWKYGGDAPFPLLGKFCKTILNGCLHWLVSGNQGSLQVYSFNMEKDRGHSFAPPKLGSICRRVELVVVGNHLGLIGCSSDRQYVEIWSMKDYGVTSSWGKYIVVRIPSNLSKPVAFGKNEELKFIWNQGVLLSYNPIEKKYTGSCIPGRPRKGGDIWIYTPSFLSLTHLCLGSRLRVKNAKLYFP